MSFGTKLSASEKMFITFQQQDDDKGGNILASNLSKNILFTVEKKSDINFYQNEHI